MTDPFSSSLGDERGISTHNRIRGQFTELQITCLRILRNQGSVLTRIRRDTYEELVDMGLAERTDDWGGTMYKLTLKGYEIAGRRTNDKVPGGWMVVGGILGDEGFNAPASYDL